jgi:tripartite-type tricarboxylate transporter receptor subunit TctC
MIRILLSTVAITLSLATLTHAGDYPSKPIRIIEPTAAGAAPDGVLRMMGEAFQADWGQPGVVENYGGAGGIAGFQLAAASAPDGYTIIAGNIGPLAILPNLKKNLPYDADKDFVPLQPVLTYPNVLVVSQNSPIKSVGELIEYAKQNPGKMTFATNGVGQSPHLSAELLKIVEGINLKIVPYKGTAAAVTDVVGGHVDAMFANSGAVIQLVNNKALRALAVTSLDRNPSLPDIPTMAEAGVKDFEVMVWVGMLARAGTPKDVVDKLNDEMRKVLDGQAAKDFIKSIGASPLPGTPAEFGEFIKSERAKWGELIRKANIVLE